MNKLKVMTVIGTRPEIIRLSRVMVALDRHMEQVIVHTGQNYDYELNQVFFEDLELRKPDYFLDAVGNTACETVGKIIATVDEALSKEKPDALLVLGDTNSCLAAYPAKRRKVPVFHMEAGNRCFDQRVPEEINRKIIDHISDINMPYSAIAREYLLREGFPPDQVIKTGSPMFEVLYHYMPKVEASRIMEKLSLEERSFFLVSCHREENVDSDINLKKFVNALNRLSEIFGQRVIVTTHPRTRKKLDECGLELHSCIELHKPFGLSDYIKLELSARATLSDSGTITEESSILNFPALNIREAHERPEGMEEGAVMMTGLDADRILQGLDVLSFQQRGDDRTLRLVSDYDAPNVSDKVARIIMSYTDCINRKIWKKN
jgi:UDP-N-acetylglucosamine 2-epimerase (non-hydrolysing)